MQLELQAGNTQAHRDRRLPRGLQQGPYTLAAPENMPSDAFLATHERNVAAAQALFWAKTHQHNFAAFRDVDFTNMNEETEQELAAAIEQESLVTDEDVTRAMHKFLLRMDPTEPAVGCA
jgi:hypothetical protein